MTEFNIEDLLPMSPNMGPPLPRFLGILWPWAEEKPEEEPEELAHRCPYCTESFASLDELIDHVSEKHPDKPPLKRIEIQWE